MWQLMSGLDLWGTLPCLPLLLLLLPPLWADQSVSPTDADSPKSLVVHPPSPAQKNITSTLDGCEVQHSCLPSPPAIICHSSYHRSSRLGYQPPTHTYTLTLSTVDAFSAWLLGMTPPSTASWSTQSSSTAHTASRSTGESGAEGSTWGEG